MEDKKIFIGEVLKRLRKSKKLSQEELAFRCNLDRTFISMLERDIKQPTITTIFGIAGALEMKPSELVKEIEKETDNHFTDKPF